MLNEYNASGRHHIPKMKFRVKNWAEYDAGLRRRGSLTLWITPEVCRLLQWFYAACMGLFLALRAAPHSAISATASMADSTCSSVLKAPSEKRTLP